MTWLLPRPLLSLSLAVLWLVLAARISAGQIALALLLAIAIPQCLPAPRVRGRPLQPWAVLRLALVVAGDVVVSSFIVARLVLGPISRLRPTFALVPLDTRHPYARALLASIITMVPGAVTVDIDEARGALLVHALDAPSPEVLVARIKRRYEAPLREIFGC